MFFGDNNWNPHTSARHFTLVRNMKLKVCLLGAVLFIVVVGGALLSHRVWRRAHGGTKASSPSSAQQLAAAEQEQAGRQVYPFSVVPGGVYSSTEVSENMALDPVVREHYKDIQPKSLRPSRTEDAMLAYVSYRKGAVVAWTRHQIHIPKGEHVLTDGKNLIRARCGNRIRKLPPPLASEVLPPGEEPPALILESPSPSQLTAAMHDPGEPPVPPPGCEGAGCEPPWPPPGCVGAGCLPPPPPACVGNNCPPPPCVENKTARRHHAWETNCPPPDCVGDNCPPPACVGKNCPPPACEGDNCPPPHPPVPEPGTLILLASGLGGGAVWKFVRLRRK